MLLYIIGFSGAGKSTLAQSLAQEWSIPALDTDLLFCQKHQTDIAEYVKQQGWQAFRQQETEILLGTRDFAPGFPSSYPGYRAIVACGGGIVEAPENRDFLLARRVLWLAPPWQTLFERISKQSSAFAAGKSEAELYQAYLRRLPLYRECLR
jgi:shikimate kinase